MLSLFVSLLFASPLDAEITVKVFTSKEIAPYEHLIVAQRQLEFSGYPYLMWHGDALEKWYAEWYTKAPMSSLAVAFCNGEVAGFVTGMPLSYFDSVAHDEFGIDKIGDQISIDTKKNYYFGDVIVLKKFRGKKISDRLLAVLENHVKSLHFESVSLITVIRPHDHPQKPADYNSSAPVWERNGYAKAGTITYQWPTKQLSNTFKVEKNPCDIWIKKFS